MDFLDYALLFRLLPEKGLLKQFRIDLRYIINHSSTNNANLNPYKGKLFLLLDIVFEYIYHIFSPQIYSLTGAMDSALDF